MKRAQRITWLNGINQSKINSARQLIWQFTVCSTQFTVCIGKPESEVKRDVLNLGTYEEGELTRV